MYKNRYTYIYKVYLKYALAIHSTFSRLDIYLNLLENKMGCAPLITDPPPTYSLTM